MSNSHENHVSQDSKGTSEAPDLITSSSITKKRSKSVDLNDPVVLLNVKPLPDATQRRLSQGDIPLGLGDKPAEDNTHASKEDINFLLGRAVRYQKVRLTEVAPSHSSIRGGEEAGNWKMSLEQFTSKKQAKNKKWPKRLRSYYKAQDELITAFEDIALDVEVELHPANPNNTSIKKAALFSKITFMVNLCLLAAKAVASALSGSISIISSLVDSCLDLFSGVIMWWATRAVKHRDPYTYPQGRTKLEPVAIIILAVVMALCSVQLIREAIEKIVDISGMSSTLPTVDAVTFAIAGSTVVTKFILWMICRKVNSPIVQALAQDHRNDVLSNTVAIVCGYLGSKNFHEISKMYGFAYLDPAGAVLICMYIIFNWWQTGSEQIKLLTGHTARPDFLSKLTWVCFNHHPLIQQIDTVRAFHFGSNFLVEVDIILPSEMPLKDAHDIGESLQHRLESIPEVERAFVHLDYEYTHHPRSEHKIV